MRFDWLAENLCSNSNKFKFQALLLLRQRGSSTIRMFFYTFGFVSHFAIDLRQIFSIPQKMHKKFITSMNFRSLNKYIDKWSCHNFD